jgi:protein-L-isoaspartate(D-aspartate) O-methyltransferase
MVERLRDHYGIRDLKVLEAMRSVPRHFFVTEALRGRSYDDNALPIDFNQTISQPFIVARMTELLELDKKSRVLEIGAGSGYQTAVLAQLAWQVYSIERLGELARQAQSRIRELGIHNATVKAFDGTLGWNAYGPYDGILVAAGGPRIPDPLIAQLRTGGRLVIPIGDTRETQKLIRIIKSEGSHQVEEHGPCQFVPLIGQHGWSLN